MNAKTIVVDVLLSLSLLITALSAVGAVVLRSTFGKLHYLTPVTSVAGPLFGAALVIDTGWGITAGLDLLIVGLLALAGPVLEVSAGRTAAEAQGAVEPEEPQ